MERYRHHGFTQEQIREAGSTESLVESQWARIKSEIVSEPLVCEWNIGSNNWGRVWVDVKHEHFMYQVTAGISGCMSGVIVAEFSSYDSAQAFADDFREGKIFAIINGADWQKYINAAHSTRKFSTDQKAHLLSLGRQEGRTLDGKLVNATSLKASY